MKDQDSSPKKNCETKQKRLKKKQDNEGHDRNVIANSSKDEDLASSIVEFVGDQNLGLF